MQNFYTTNSKNEMLERFFSLNLDFLCIADMNGNFIKVNAIWENIFGYSTEELEHKKCIDFVHPLDLEATRFAMEKPLNQHEILSFVNRYRSKDNTYRTIEWRSRTYEDFIYIAGKDITEKKSMEAALVKAKDQAEIGSTVKSQFLGKVSHEIRTPMNGILGFLQLLEKTTLTSEQSMFVNNMKLSTTLLNKVINDILDINKMAVDEVALEVIPFNLYTAVEDAVIPFTASAYTKKITIDLFIQPGTPEYVMGDPARLQQIISNLISNAVKFTEQGGIVIEVSLEETFKSVHRILFKVKDTGIGIPGDGINRLFEPFIQEDNSTTRKYEGTGLGLAITKNLVEAMRGKISAESEEGKGSVFFFTALLMIDQNQHHEEKADYAILNGRSIMIVDESPDDSGRLRDCLEKEGVDIKIVPSGAHAMLELMKFEDPCDGVLVSQDLSDIKAYDLSVALGVISTTKDIPLILMSSKISFEVEDTKSTNKFTNKISKPFRKNQLLSTLAAIIKYKENKLEKSDQEEPKIKNLTPEVRNKHSNLLAEAHLECNRGIMEKEPDDGLENPEKRQRVLIVDDSQVNTKLLEMALSENFNTQIANSGKEALSVANSDNPPDLILLDIMMPEMNGYEVCKILHQEQKTKDIPVIFLTALNESENVEYGLKLGAIDYITKPFSIPIVKAKIKNHLALKYYQDILKINTDVDQLTQIANRRRFDEMLAIESKKAKRTGSFLTVLLIDIDHFKLYNDTYGHLEGDECLRQVAYALKTSLKRPGDLAARWGGEEFTCLLPDTDARAAAGVGEKLRKVIMNLGIYNKKSPVKNVVTVSIGVVTSIPEDHTSYDKLLKQADEALYQAKESGRNRISQWISQ